MSFPYTVYTINGVIRIPVHLMQALPDNDICSFSHQRSQGRKYHDFWQSQRSELVALKEEYTILSQDAEVCSFICCTNWLSQFAKILFSASSWFGWELVIYLYLVNVHVPGRLHNASVCNIHLYSLCITWSRESSFAHRSFYIEIFHVILVFA